MQPPFTAEQFLGVSRAYDTALRPEQVMPDLGLAVLDVAGLVLVWKAGSPTASPPEAAGATP